MLNAHHPYFLDFKVQAAEPKSGPGNSSIQLDQSPEMKESDLSPVPKWVSQQDSDGRAFNEIIWLINALTGYHIFQYDGRQAWTVSLSDSKSFHYSQEFYNAPEF